MLLLVQKMKVLVISYQTKPFLKLVSGNLCKILSPFFIQFSHAISFFIFFNCIIKINLITYFVLYFNS